MNILHFYWKSRCILSWYDFSKKKLSLLLLKCIYIKYNVNVHKNTEIKAFSFFLFFLFFFFGEGGGGGEMGVLSFSKKNLSMVKSLAVTDVRVRIRFLLLTFDVWNEGDSAFKKSNFICGHQLSTIN